MLIKKRRNYNNSINAGSMADIAFLLLIFFLVTTQIVEDKGILVQLPPWEIGDPPPPPPGKNVLMILINSENELLVESEKALVSDLKETTKYFISNPLRRIDLPSSPKNAIISLKNDRSTSYTTYIEVYNELKAAYRELRDEEALKTYGKLFLELGKEDQKKIREKVPLVISESEPSDVLVVK